MNNTEITCIKVFELILLVSMLFLLAIPKCLLLKLLKGKFLLHYSTCIVLTNLRCQGLFCRPLQRSKRGADRGTQMADWLHETSTPINVVVALIAFLSVGSEL